MSRKANNRLLQQAKVNKKDEFYTQLCDIERELQHYANHFRNKVVYCNCDDYRVSNFSKYFKDNFKALKLKGLICVNYSKQGSNSYAYLFNGEESKEKIVHLKGNGDFRSAESVHYLKIADVVVTNPPFSLFRDYVDQLVFYNKKFLIIGNVNAITYKNIFKLIQNNEAWLGINLGRGISGFIVPKEYELYGQETKIDENGNQIVSPNNCLWLTNLENEIRKNDLPLEKKYYGNESFFPKYDNFNGINVNKTKDIPSDFYGYMGVPITFLHKFNPSQFSIIKFRKGDDEKDLSVNGRCPYFRIIIKRNVCVTSAV